jgi:hypothetical protein
MLRFCSRAMRQDGHGKLCWHVSNDKVHGDTVYLGTDSSSSPTLTVELCKPILYVFMFRRQNKLTKRKGLRTCVPPPPLFQLGTLQAGPHKYGFNVSF